MTVPMGIFSREAYRDWCAQQPLGRFERVEGRIVPMARERIGHVRMKGSVYTTLHRAVTEAGLPCEVLPSGVTVETGECDYEPDAVVNGGARMDNEAFAAPNPVIVVEVLSPGAQSTDTGAKLADYFQVPSVVHYLIAHPTRRRIIHHRRAADGINTRIVSSGEIAMDPPGIIMTMDEIYGN